MKNKVINTPICVVLWCSVILVLNISAEPVVETSGLTTENKVSFLPKLENTENDHHLDVSRVKRSAINEDQPHKKKSKKKEARRKIAINLVESIVEEKLQEHLKPLVNTLDPLATALKLVRLDAFSEGILRQLSSLEHIQSKLLTEFGELRAAVSEVGRHTLDLGRQVSGLDERLTALGRWLPHRLDLSGSRNGYRSDSNSRSSNGQYSEMSQTTEILKDALISITSKLSGTERRVKDDILSLGNRTADMVKASQTHLERRIAEVALDTEKLLASVEMIGNKSSAYCPFPFMPQSSPSASIHTDRYFRRPGSSFSGLPKYKMAQETSMRDDLIYLADNGGSRIREERQHPPAITPFNGWVPSAPAESPTLNLGTVSRLATEITKQIINHVDYKQPKDCYDIALGGERRSSIYTIYPATCTKRFNVQVWCELEESSGSWTVIQSRGPWDKSHSLGMQVIPVDFFKDWISYKWGFGSLKGEFWLGNEYIHQITESGDYDLRIELEDWTGESRWAEYSHFYIENEAKNYSLHFGEYTGNAGNSLKHHQGVSFSTKDRDNDSNPKGHCARTFHGAWWFTSCHESHLNGRYHRGRHKSYGEGINWLAFRGHNYSLMNSRMMIRPSKASKKQN